MVLQGCSLCQVSAGLSVDSSTVYDPPIIEIWPIRDKAPHFLSYLAGRIDLDSCITLSQWKDMADYKVWLVVSRTVYRKESVVLSDSAIIHPTQIYIAIAFVLALYLNPHLIPAKK